MTNKLTSIVLGIPLGLFATLISSGALDSWNNHDIKNRLLGKRFNKLTVLSFLESKDRHTYWLCKCDCGNQIEVMGKQITAKRADIKTCGCHKKGKNNPRFGKIGELSPNFGKKYKKRELIFIKKSLKNSDFGITSYN
jgi:hypothetical protein